MSFGVMVYLFLMGSRHLDSPRFAVEQISTQIGGDGLRLVW